MKTIEERAKEKYCTHCGARVEYNCSATDTPCNNIKAYIEIAREQKAIDIKQLKDWLKHNIVKYAGMFTEHFKDEDGRETIKVCPCVDAALYDDLKKAMEGTK